MFERSRKNNATPEMTRRGFLTGAVAASALVAANLPSKIEEKQNDLPEADVTVVEKQPTKLVEELSTYESSNSAWFLADVEKYSEIYKRELSHVLPLASLPTKHDVQERSRMQYIGEMLAVEGVSMHTQDILRKLFQALPIVESGYDANATSEDGARSLMQIMQNVWKEHATADMNPQSLVDQVNVVGKYLSQTHRHLQTSCGDAFERIAYHFFDGNKEAFESQFLAPVIITAYFVGMGTMADVVSWFDTQFKSKEDTIEALSQSEILTGYDLFYMLAHTAFQAEANKNLGENGLVYTLKVYGARKMLDDNLDDVQKALLFAKL